MSEPGCLSSHGFKWTPCSTNRMLLTSKDEGSPPPDCENSVQISTLANGFRATIGVSTSEDPQQTAGPRPETGLAAKTHDISYVISHQCLEWWSLRQTGDQARASSFPETFTIPIKKKRLPGSGDPFQAEFVRTQGLDLSWHRQGCCTVGAPPIHRL